jgi:hypothetical protein
VRTSPRVATAASEFFLEVLAFDMAQRGVDRS